MKSLLMTGTAALAYGFAWYAGYLIKQGDYALAAINTVTVAIQLCILFSLIVEKWWLKKK